MLHRDIKQFKVSRLAAVLCSSFAPGSSWKFFVPATHFRHIVHLVVGRACARGRLQKPDIYSTSLLCVAPAELGAAVSEDRSRFFVGPHIFYLHKLGQIRMSLLCFVLTLKEVIVLLNEKRGRYLFV